MCHSLMKRVPPSQVSFRRGVGQEGVRGRSSGVKRLGGQCVQFTVTQHSRCLSLPFFNLLSPCPQLQTEDNAVEEPNTETFKPSFLLLKICQNVDQHHDDLWIFSLNGQESCQSKTSKGSPVWILQRLQFSDFAEASQFFLVIHCLYILTMDFQRLAPLFYPSLGCSHRHFGLTTHPGSRLTPSL